MDYFTTKSLIIKIKDKHTVWLDSYVKSFKWEQNLEDIGSPIKDNISIVKDANIIEIEVGDLENVMNWCVKHPKMCQKIAENGFELLNNIVEDKVLLKDMAYTIESISSKSDMTLKYTHLRKEDEIYKTKQYYKVQMNQLDYLRYNLEKLEYETNTKIEIPDYNEYYGNGDNISIIITGFSYNIDKVIEIIDTQFTNVYEQIIDLPLRIKS